MRVDVAHYSYEKTAFTPTTDNNIRVKRVVIVLSAIHHRKMKQKFPWMRFYTPKDKPIGPHPLPMWEADFASYDNRIFWSEVCDFIKAEHDGLSVLIHPHSMDGDYADHTKNAFWVGDVLELRIQEWKR